ncbi:Uncharacterised protein [Corynebacterium striatum]|nr:Uncharacterised protein [Corynebacterium striatum]STD62684.1 Uncharacterised protein [Corynebacterium striatum]VFB07667.1 Uncharacterised protein [Corynebacterium striatum]
MAMNAKIQPLLIIGAKNQNSAAIFAQTYATFPQQITNAP